MRTIRNEILNLADHCSVHEGALRAIKNPVETLKDKMTSPGKTKEDVNSRFTVD